MATNEFLPHATGVGATGNLMSQADWDISTDRVNGFPGGILTRQKLNKALRQSTSMAAALGQAVSNTLSVDVADNGDVDTLAILIASAFGGGGGGGSTIYIDPRLAAYGASPINTPEQNSTAFDAAFVAAAAQNAYVVLPPGIYDVNQIHILNGCRGFLGAGGELRLADFSNAGILVAGPEFGNPEPVSNCTIQGLRINANNVTGPTVCIWADNASDVRVLDNVIINVSHGYGILFRNYTAAGVAGGGNKIQRNKVFGDPTNYGGAPQNWFGIFVDAQYVLGTASTEIDYWRKNFIDAPVIQYQSGYDITENRVVGGYYGIGLGHVVDSVISDNNVQNNMRGISVQHSCVRNSIVGNKVFQNYSAGIHLTFGSSFNSVVANHVYTTVGVGEALIQAYIGCQSNLIDGNTLTNQQATTGQEHGIYVAVNASNNTISNNMINGNFRLAAIGVASAWDASNTTIGWPYRYGSASDGRNTDWMANADTVDVVVSGNTIHRTSNVPAILLDQCTTHAGVTYTGPSGFQSVWDAGYTGSFQAGLTNVTLKDNVVLGPSGVENLRIYEDTSGKNSSHLMLNNRFSVSAGTHTQAEAATYFVLPRYRAHFLDTQNNFPYDANVSAFIIPATTTPNVSVGKYFAAGGGTGQFTSFLGGIDGQEIQVRLDTSTGITHTPGGGADTIRLNQGRSILVGKADSDTWYSFRRQGGVWFELGNSYADLGKPVSVTGSSTILPSLAYTKVIWNTVVSNDRGEWGVNSFTCKRTGLYQINALIANGGTPIWEIDTGLKISIYLNGVRIADGQQTATQSAGGHNFQSSIAYTIYLIAGDIIDFYGFVSNVAGATLSGVAYQNWVNIVRIS